MNSEVSVAIHGVRGLAALATGLLFLLMLLGAESAEGKAVLRATVSALPGRLGDSHAPEVLEAIRSVRTARMRMGAGKRIFTDVIDEVREIRSASMNLVNALARGDGKNEIALLDGHADLLEAVLKKLRLKHRGDRFAQSRLDALSERCRRLLGQLRRVGKGRTRAAQSQRALELIRDLDTAGGRASRALSGAPPPTFTIQRAAPDLRARRARRERRMGNHGADRRSMEGR